MGKKIIFMGTPEIAVPSLRALLDMGFDIPLILSQPDKPKGRGKKIQHTAVKEVALEYGIEIYQPEKLKNNEEVLEKLSKYGADFFAVVAYGKILPKLVLDIPLKACINVHFSLLPLYRGAAPVNWAIINGDKETGVSTMKMDSGMDTGDILLVKSTPTLKKDAVELSKELSISGANLLLETISNFDNIIPFPQGDGATYAPIMKKEDGLINWNLDAVSIERMIRGFAPWPAAYSFFNGKLIKIYRADIDYSISADAGEVAFVSKDFFSIGTGDGALVVYEVQLEGKRRMSVSEFLSGNKVSVGVRFGIKQ